MDADAIARDFRSHYGAAFRRHGATPMGVDWGSDPVDHEVRLDRMIDVMLGVPELARRPRLLDVGCGFGSLLDRMKARGISVDYVGIDVVRSMVDHARDRHPEAEWIHGDFLRTHLPGGLDYVVCNGILTQKLETPISAMDVYFETLVRRMFHLSQVGTAFNVMSTHVNWRSPNLYYRDPAETLDWCLSLSPFARVDASYKPFEFTAYLFKLPMDRAPSAPSAPPAGLHDDG